jgi:hypothetical protein
MRVENETRSSRTDVRRVAPKTFVAALRRQLGTSASAGARPSTRPVRLQPARPPAAPVGSVVRALRRARAEMEAGVEARLEAGACSLAAAEARLVVGRAGDLERTTVASVRPTAPEPGRPPPLPQPWTGGAVDPPAGERARSGRLEAALALVERVETFLRSGRPALAFTIGGAFRQSVELERLGPRRVALWLRGGTFGPAETRQLAATLAAQGIVLTEGRPGRGRPRG